MLILFCLVEFSSETIWVQIFLFQELIAGSVSLLIIEIIISYCISCRSLCFLRLLSKSFLSCQACLFPGHLVRQRRLFFLLLFFFFSFLSVCWCFKFTSFSSMPSGIKGQKKKTQEVHNHAPPCVRVPTCLSPSLTFSVFLLKFILYVMMSRAFCSTQWDNREKQICFTFLRVEALVFYLIFEKSKGLFFTSQEFLNYHSCFSCAFLTVS